MSLTFLSFGKQMDSARFRGVIQVGAFWVMRMELRIVWSR